MRWRAAFLASVITAVVATASSQPHAQAQNPPARPAQNPPAGGAPNAPVGGAQLPDATAAGAPEIPQGPTFRGGVNVVRVDAIVNDKKTGKPVLDLKPEDFEITEAGKKQTINTFKLISLDGGLMSTDGPPRPIRTEDDEEIEAQKDDVRLFGIFLDDYHVTRDNSRAARDQLARFVRTQFGPSDMIAIMRPLDPLAAVRAGRNQEAIARALEQFEGRKYDYTPKMRAEEYVYYASAEQVERIRNEVSLQAIRAFILKIGGLKDGRKGLILVSEGYSNILPPQMRDPIAGSPGYQNPNSNNPLAADRPFTSQMFESMDMNIQLQDVWDLANRYNTAIYTVDPRGLAASEFGIERNVGARTDSTYLNSTLDTLRVLAENSDGRAIVNRNDFVVGMKQVVIDSSAYYLLGYNSTASTPDGKFHEIKVTVKRPGVELRGRKGYWALKADAAARLASPAAPAAPNPLDAALAATVVPRGRSARTWVGTERGAAGKTRVRLVWEPVRGRPGDVASDRVPARITVTATAPDGSMLFRGRAPESSTGAAPAGGTLAFDAPPGKLQLRLVMEGDGPGDIIDSEQREIVVPDFTAPVTAFGTPQVFRARTVPEMQRVKADPQATPVVTREFSRTDRLLIVAGTYAPGQVAPKVTARLLNRANQRVADIDVTRRDDGAALAEVALASLAPGEYGVELAATGDAGEARQLVAFRITP